MNDTRKLVDFVLDTNYADIPKKAIALCKKHLMDCTGAALSAVNQPAGNIAQSYIKSLNNAGQARIIGYGLGTSVDNAAFGNGILAHVNSFDDSGPSHPSVTVVPTLYALGELTGTGGQNILATQAIGYEVFQKLNRVTQKARQIRDNGWHPTGFFGAVTSALISAKLLELNTDQSLNAVGIAASMGAGLSRNIGNMTMSLHAGNASRNGITAALLARQGFTGDEAIIEGKFGLMTALAGPGNYHIELLTKDLGNPFSIIDPGINIKSYPCCWGHHRLLDAMFHLVETLDLKPSDVLSIECDTQPEKSTGRYLTPKTEFEARYSIGYGLAAILLDRELTFKQYKPDRVNRADIHEVMSKINYMPRPQEDPDKYKVSLILQDGTRYEKNVVYPKGHAGENPLSDEELVKKYTGCAETVLSAEKIEKSIELFQNFETLRNINTLVDSVIID